MTFAVNPDVATCITTDGSGVAFYHRLSGATQLVRTRPELMQAQPDFFTSEFSQDAFCQLVDLGLEDPIRVLNACLVGRFFRNRSNALD